MSLGRPASLCQPHRAQSSRESRVRCHDGCSTSRVRIWTSSSAPRRRPWIMGSVGIRDRDTRKGAVSPVQNETICGRPHPNLPSTLPPGPLKLPARPKMRTAGAPKSSPKRIATKKARESLPPGLSFSARLLKIHALTLLCYVFAFPNELECLFLRKSDAVPDSPNDSGNLPNARRQRNRVILTAKKITTYSFRDTCPFPHSIVRAFQNSLAPPPSPLAVPRP